MEKESSTKKPPQGKSSLKWTHAINNTNEPVKKMKEPDERFYFNVTLDEISVWQNGECPVNTTKSTE